MILLKIKQFSAYVLLYVIKFQNCSFLYREEIKTDSRELTDLRYELSRYFYYSRVLSLLWGGNNLLSKSSPAKRAHIFLSRIVFMSELCVFLFFYFMQCLRRDVKLFERIMKIRNS